jgi:ABC-type xylose transport system permease subunit
VLEVSGAETKFRPIVDVTRVVIAGMLLGAWSVFWITYTVRKTAAWR